VLGCAAYALYSATHATYATASAVCAASVVGVDGKSRVVLLAFHIIEGDGSIGADAASCDATLCIAEDVAL
jgi:hypothetical protein